MDSKEIEELLRKYWECETSLEEEEELRRYFREHRVPENLKQTAALFEYFELQKHHSVNEQFDEAVVRSLNSSSKGKNVSLMQMSLRIAAGIAVLIAAVFFVRYEINDKQEIALEDTYDDPQKALEETKKALLIISRGFGKAEQQAKKINVLNEAQEKIKSKPEENKNKL